MPPDHLTDLPEAVYLPLSEGRFESTAWSRGPWDPNGQHAGPTAALLAHSMERHDLGDADPSQVLMARVTVDLIRPAPLSPLDVAVRTVRAGRRAHWLESTLSADGKEVARATGVRLVEAPLDLPSDLEQGLRPAPPGPETVEPLPPDDGPDELFFWYAVDVHPLTPPDPGPGTVWFHLRVPLIAGVETTPLMRTMTAADFTLGISSPLGFERYTYPNADLSVHLHRYPTDPWICIDAATMVSPRGSGYSEATLHDRSGPIGRACQSLVLGTWGS